MDPDSMNDVLAEAGMLLKPDRATKEMQRSISKFASLLTCPLCNKIFDKPATLTACGHTFCMNCIDEYSSNNCNCPVEGCGMPLSIVGGKGGSFRKINLDISQTIESIQLICKSLNRSEENWWVAPDALRSIKETKKLKMKGRSVLPESDDFPSDGQVSKDEDLIENDDDEMIDLQNDDEMIDLQADEEEESCLSTAGSQDINGNISEGEESL